MAICMAIPAPMRGSCAFAVRPAGDTARSTPVRCWSTGGSSGRRCTRKGSKGAIELLGATADDVFAMSRSELQRSVLSDPGVQLDACGRKDIAAGAIDRRVLAVLEFLSRSGLQPTVGALRCARSRNTGPAPFSSTSTVGQWRSPRSTASRSPGIRGRGRSRTPRFALCSRSAASSRRTGSSASCSTQGSEHACAGGRLGSHSDRLRRAQRERACCAHRCRPDAVVLAGGGWQLEQDPVGPVDLPHRGAAAADGIREAELGCDPRPAGGAHQPRTRRPRPRARRSGGPRGA